MVLARNVENGVELRLDGANLRCTLPCGVPVTLEGVLGTTVRVLASATEVIFDTFVGPGNESIKRKVRLDQENPRYRAEQAADPATKYLSLEHLVGDCLVAVNGGL